LVSYDVLTGIFPIGGVGALVMLLLSVPLGGIGGYLVERLAFTLGGTYGRRVALTLGASALVFLPVAINVNLVAILLDGSIGLDMARVLMVCVVAAGPILVGGWLYFRAMVAPREQQLLLAVPLLVLGALAVAADRAISFNEYSVVHVVLRWGSVAGLGSALFLLFPEDLAVPRVHSLGLAPAFIAGIALFPYAQPEFAPGMQAKPFGRLVLGTAQSLVDFDRDGYAQWLGNGDCAPFDASVNPGRREIAGNRVDDNCRLGDARIHAPVPADASGPITVPDDAPSILLITADALRADHVSSYGYERPTTPHLDEWAKQSALFTSAFTPGTRTGTSLPSLHYGVWAERLAWTPLFDTTAAKLVPQDKLKPGELVRRVTGFALEQPRPSLAKLLRERGYKTAAVVDDGKSPVLYLKPGFQSDYDSYWQMKEGQGRPYGDEATTAKARETLKSLAAGRFFMWVHYFGTHMPSTRTKGIPDFGSDTPGEYDHEVRTWDEALSKLLADADELAKTRKMVIVVSSDHGEVFFPIGRGHGVSASEADFHVPLVVRAPGMPIGRNDALVSLLDVVPMLLDLTGGTQGVQLDGIDLRDLAAEPTRTRDRVVFTGSSAFRTDLSAGLLMTVALGSGRKVVFDHLRNEVTVWKLGDFSDAVMPHDAASDRVLQALLRHIETTPGMALAPSP
jgi:arylsulfatase